MSNLTFHKCKICKCIFYSCGKTTYCSNCIPKFTSPNKAMCLINKSLDNSEKIQLKRKHDRERWHKRMEDPLFREHERLRNKMRQQKEVKNDYRPY